MKTTNEIRDIISGMGTAARVNRIRAAHFFIKHPSHVPLLIASAVSIDYKDHHKAAWILEFVLEKHLDWIIPSLTVFTDGLSQLKNDSAVRPVAKICQWITKAYCMDKISRFLNAITTKHLDKILTTGFDWMIGDFRVASKVYTMDTLYYIGKLQHKKYSWVHQELKAIILHDIHQGSAGYKSHGNKLLKLLEV